jgi:hypothetical protein
LRRSLPNTIGCTQTPRDLAPEEQALGSDNEHLVEVVVAAFRFRDLSRHDPHPHEVKDMEIPDEYRKAAHRSAIFSELAKFIMTRLLAKDAAPLLSPKLFVNEAVVPEAAFHQVLLEILTRKGEEDRVMGRYGWVQTDRQANRLPEPQPRMSGATPRDRSPSRRRSASRRTD